MKLTLGVLASLRETNPVVSRVSREDAETREDAKQG